MRMRYWPDSGWVVYWVRVFYTELCEFKFSPATSSLSCYYERDRGFSISARVSTLLHAVQDAPDLMLLPIFYQI